MPGGPTTFGVAYFTAVKLAGYSAAGRYINRLEGTIRPHPLLFGGVRTVLGVAAGVSYGYLLGRLSITNEELAFYAGLIPVRILEWLLLLWLFYRAVPNIENKRTMYVAKGVGWSYVLDLPAILAAFTLPGGFWVC